MGTSTRVLGTGSHIACTTKQYGTTSFTETGQVLQTMLREWVALISSHLQLEVERSRCNIEVEGFLEDRVDGLCEATHIIKENGALLKHW